MSVVILIVLSLVLVWEVADRVRLTFASLFLPRATRNEEAQLGGFITGNLISIFLLVLGVFGIVGRNWIFFSLAALSYLISGIAESLRISRKAAGSPTRVFYLLLVLRYIVPIGLGYVWFLL